MTNPAEEVRRFAMEQLAAELAASEAAKLRPPSTRSGGQADGATVVISLRVDRDMLAALHRRAALYEVKPTVLARNLIRTGLSAPTERQLPTLVERLDEVLTDLRVLVT